MSRELQVHEPWADLVSFSAGEITRRFSLALASLPCQTRNVAGAVPEPAKQSCIHMPKGSCGSCRACAGESGAAVLALSARLSCCPAMLRSPGDVFRPDVHLLDSQEDLVLPTSSLECRRDPMTFRSGRGAALLSDPQRRRSCKRMSLKGLRQVECRRDPMPVRSGPGAALFSGPQHAGAASSCVLGRSCQLERRRDPMPFRSGSGGAPVRNHLLRIV